jgi:signal transduction histidine kinase
LARKLENALQAQLELFETHTAPRIKRLVSDISHLTDNTSGALVLSEQSEELKLLKERQAYLVEMSQLGLILEAANHEHEKQVECIRSGLATLTKKLPEDSQKTLKAVSDSFEIIDARMRLFDPLIRRKSATVNEISGSEIHNFLEIRFKDAFSEHLVDVTKNFTKASWSHVKPPVFLGAIHNIFHNALYWCKKGTEKPQIRLSAAGPLLTISDSGPGISKRDKDRIFEPGFSRRPFGRGLGLYIAREALRGIGFDLYCPSEPELGALNGANFTILPKNYADR